MKTKQRQFLSFLLLLFFPLLIQGQTTFVNKGGMNVGKSGTSGSDTVLYIPGSARLSGASGIAVKGIVQLNGDLIANELLPGFHAFDDAGSKNGKLLMRGSTRQRIYAGDGTLDRVKSYIGKLPVLEIDNRQGVILADSMGLSIDTLNLVKGKFILGSRYIDGTKTRMAHLLVNDNVVYNRTDTAIVEIQMALGNTVTERNGRFMGFSPPFKKMYADYFTYNYLLVPDRNGLSGATKKTIEDPGYPLEAGHGYIIGQNVYDYSLEDDYIMLPAWNLNADSYAHRMQDTLLMNRYALQGIRIVDTKSGSGIITQADAYTSESLNTSDVKIALQEGYNYLGNPFTCPLNLADLKAAVAEGEIGSDAWGVSRDPLEENDIDLYTGFWVMHNGYVKAVNPDTKKITIAVSYDVIQEVGSTGTTDSIAPMQLFMVYANRPCELTIPAAKRTHGYANYLKSSRANSIIDELLLEVRDQQTEGYDRMCVVFRDNATLNSGDAYDASKPLNTSGSVSQLYNVTPNGKNLAVSVIPTDATSLPLTLAPSATEQEVELTASRLESLQSPETVLLEDLLMHNITDLTQDSYRFTTAPSDDPNRFVLHFKDTRGAVSGMDANFVTPIYIAYQSGELKIKGLQATDAGSTISVTDVQGRTLLRETLPAGTAETGAATYRLPLSAGIYIVDLSGARCLTTKFVKQ